MGPVEAWQSAEPAQHLITKLLPSCFTLESTMCPVACDVFCSSASDWTNLLFDWLAVWRPPFPVPRVTFDTGQVRQLLPNLTRRFAKQWLNPFQPHFNVIVFMEIFGALSLFIFVFFFSFIYFSFYFISLLFFYFFSFFFFFWGGGGWGRVRGRGHFWLRNNQILVNTYCHRASNIFGHMIQELCLDNTWLQIGHTSTRPLLAETFNDKVRNKLLTY